MAQSKFARRMTIDEYFDVAERSPARLEYVDGDVFEMSGNTRRHNAIVGNIYLRLRAAATGSRCRVHFSEIKLKVDRVVYCPDVMVACGAEPVDERVEVAPGLLFEVLSPSTESTDRREKLLVYKQIPSVRAYFIVDQMQKRVDAHVRDTNGEWLRESFVDEGTLRVANFPFDVMLTLDAIYERITMPTPEQQLRLREEEATFF